jgi:hypothetical protein
VQLCHYFVSKSSEFCRHNPLSCFSTSVYFCLFRYGLSPESFGYTHVHQRTSVSALNSFQDGHPKLFTCLRTTPWNNTVLKAVTLSASSQHVRQLSASRFTSNGRWYPCLSITPWIRKGSGDIAPWILNLSTRWMWMVSFTLRPLYSGEITPNTHWTGGWVGPRAAHSSSR